MSEIKYVGLKDLKDFEVTELMGLAEEEYAKLLKKVRLKEAELSVFVKKIHKGENSHHYELILKLNAPGTKKAWFDVRNEDFDLAKLVHRCFDALAANMEHEMSKALKKK